MVGGTISPPIFRAAIRIVVPGSTSTVMLSIVTFNSFFSSVIFQFKIQNSKFKTFPLLVSSDYEELRIMRAIILAISSASFNKFSTRFFSHSTVSLIRQSQYLVSFADFKAITKKFFQSLLELPDLPSTILAPIEVALLINCSNTEK